MGTLRGLGPLYLAGKGLPAPRDTATRGENRMSHTINAALVGYGFAGQTFTSRF